MGFSLPDFRPSLDCPHPAPSSFCRTGTNQPPPSQFFGAPQALCPPDLSVGATPVGGRGTVGILGSVENVANLRPHLNLWGVWVNPERCRFQAPFSMSRLLGSAAASGGRSTDGLGPRCMVPRSTPAPSSATWFLRYWSPSGRFHPAPPLHFEALLVALPLGRAE